MLTMRQARQLAGMSQKEAAKAFGVHYQTLAKWEADSSKMRMDKIREISRIYGVEPDQIYFGGANELGGKEVYFEEF